MYASREDLLWKDLKVGLGVLMELSDGHSVATYNNTNLRGGGSGEEGMYLVIRKIASDGAHVQRHKTDFPLERGRLVQEHTLTTLMISCLALATASGGPVIFTSRMEGLSGAESLLTLILHPVHRWSSIRLLPLAPMT